MADTMVRSGPVASDDVVVQAQPFDFAELEGFRGELTAFCYRMLGSGLEAEDAVQEAMLRAWRGADGFEGRASPRSWLYRIAANVCIDMGRQVQRRARPADMGPASAPDESLLGPMLPEATWVTPIPDSRLSQDWGDPAQIAGDRESVRLAFVSALQHLPPRQRAALILCEVLRWHVAEAAELLDTTTAAINSALQRARSTLREASTPAAHERLDPPDSELLERYVEAFERYDIDALVTLLRDDAAQSMPPFAMWIEGAAAIGRWMVEPGPSSCRGSRLTPDQSERLPCFRSVPGRARRGLRALGLAGSGDLRGKDHRDELLSGLPRSRKALRTVRSPPASRSVSRPPPKRARLVSSSSIRCGDTSLKTTFPPMALARSTRRDTESTPSKLGVPDPPRCHSARVTPSPLIARTVHHRVSSATRFSDVPRELDLIAGSHRRLTLSGATQISSTVSQARPARDHVAVTVTGLGNGLLTHPAQRFSVRVGAQRDLVPPMAAVHRGEAKGLSARSENSDLVDTDAAQPCGQCRVALDDRVVDARQGSTVDTSRSTRGHPRRRSPLLRPPRPCRIRL